MDIDSTTVSIFGQEYSVRGSDNAEHIRKVAAYVDKQMQDVARSAHQVSSVRVAILAAMNIADELIRNGGGSAKDDEVNQRVRELTLTLEQGLEDEAKSS